MQSVFVNHADYKIRSQKLGQGPFGDVYLAERIKDNKKFAAKLFNFQKSFDGSQQMLFLQKSLILNKLHHPALVKLIGINLQSSSDPKILQPTIITEYFGRGSLKDNLNKETIWTPTTKCINILGIISALRYLYEQGISHGNLKPNNIMIDDNNYPHICDYCLCNCFPDSLT